MNHNTQNIEQPNFIRASELRALAEANNPHAQLDLAYRLFEGVDLDRDFLEQHGKNERAWFSYATAYLERASETFMKRGDLSNSAQAEFNLGAMLMKGCKLSLGMHIDYKKAYESYESAARKFSAAEENESLFNTYLNLGLLEYRFVAAGQHQQEKFYPGKRFSYQAAFDYFAKAIECGNQRQIASMVNGLNDYGRIFGVTESLADGSRESLRRFVHILKEASSSENVHRI